jgi:hypothetical protein
LLFENFKDYIQTQKQKKQKDENNLTIEDEVGARLLALGYSKIEAYKLSHPKSKTTNKNTLYVKGCKFAGQDKIRQRVEALREQQSKESLMALTEAYMILSSLARNAGKEEVRRQAVNDILKIHGVLEENLNVKVTKLVFDKEDKEAK